MPDGTIAMVCRGHAQPKRMHYSNTIGGVPACGRMHTGWRGTHDVAAVTCRLCRQVLVLRKRAQPTLWDVTP